MSSNNRISDTTIGPPPSTNGNGQHPPAGRGSPDPVGRGSPDPAHTPDRRSPDPAPTAAAQPSTNGNGDPAPSANGRDNLGRFAPGNPGGPGNPFARHVAELRKAMAHAVPKEMLEAIMLKMAHLALEGNVAAAKFVAAYSVGQPLAGKNPDRTDIEEWQLLKEEAPMMTEVACSAPTPDPVVPLTFARVRRYADTMKKAGMMSIFGLPEKEQDRLFELGAANPHEVCNLLRDKARNPNAPPSANGKRKKRR